MSIELQNKGTYISVFTLAMINVIAIDNLRSLTAGAEYGFALVFFYLIATLLFFIPTILVTAELATGWPNTGGVYVWVREAFGAKWGFITIWLQWIYNVVWYPTIFTFIAGIIAYIISPELVNHKIYMISVTLTAFWIMTLINCFNIKISGKVSVIGAIVGTILPMVFISIMGIIWVSSGKSSQISFTIHDFFPNMSNFNNIAFLTNILFGLMGIEMSAVHAGDVNDPKRNYPRALIYSSIIILLTFVFSSLAITIVIPIKELSLVSGLMDAFRIFFNEYHMNWFTPIMGILIILGSLGGASAWILGPARGMLIASQDSPAPKIFRLSNKKEMPIGMLFIQGIIVTLLCVLYFIMPTVNSFYWVLSNLTAQLALLFYILMFAAAIRLRYKHAKVHRAYRIFGGNLGIWLVCGIGIITCISAIILGFIPPTQVTIGKTFTYEAILIIGMLICTLTPLLFLRKKTDNRI